MVKKLFKHEFLALFRLMLPVECAVLGAGILVRFMTLFETDSFVFESIAASSVLIMVVALVAGSAAATIFGVLRYYKNLFTSEGYLSFTLPVTPAQHIMVKAVTITAFELAALVIAVISFCFATAGELLVEIVKLIAYLLEKAFQELNPLHLGLFIIEVLIALVLGIILRYLIYYSCITIGQTANKHRILLAIGVYAAYSMITSFISTFINIFAGIVMSTTGIPEKLADFFEKNPYFCIHTIFLSVIVVNVLFSLVFFFISNIIIKKKLNLE